MRESPLGPLLGTGKEAEVFALGDLVAKRYRSAAKKGSAFREAAILAVVESLGLPVPSVRGVSQMDDRWAIVMTRVDGPSFAEAIAIERHSLPEYLKAMATLHKRIHNQPGAQLVDLKRKLSGGIARAEMLGDVRRSRLLASLAERPAGDRLCHGDFHPWNVLGPPGQATIIDWLDASCGDPAADACRSYVLMLPHAPEMAAGYVDAYAAATGLDREAVIAWRPVVAAARLSEGVPEIDHLMAMVDTL